MVEAYRRVLAAHSKIPCMMAHVDSRHLGLVQFNLVVLPPEDLADVLEAAKAHESLDPQLLSLWTRTDDKDRRILLGQDPSTMLRGLLLTFWKQPGPRACWNDVLWRSKGLATDQAAYEGRSRGHEQFWVVDIRSPLLGLNCLFLLQRKSKIGLAHSACHPARHTTTSAEVCEHSACLSIAIKDTTVATRVFTPSTWETSPFTGETS